MYRVTGTQKGFADVDDAIGEAVGVVMRTPVNKATVYFTSSMGKHEDRNLYTVSITPTRRLSITNLF